MNRAYSWLTVKAVDEGKRTIRGVATTPAVDRVGDIVEPLGCKFANPLPLLWQHMHDKPIGTVTFGKATADGIPFTAELPTIATPGTLQDRIEEAWQSMVAGLVRAVSIGFRPIEYSFMENGGIRFTETEVYELSAVTIPANADAVITSLKNMDAAAIAVIKSFDTNAPAATGHIERPAKTASAAPGVTGKQTKTTKPLTPQEKPMAKTIAEQISAFEQTRVSKAARMEEIMLGSEGETLDAEMETEYDTLADEVKAVDAHIVRLKALEASKLATAKPVTKAATTEEGTAHRTVAQVKATPTEKPGIMFARLAKVKTIARLDGESVASVIERIYGASGDVAAILKTAVAAGSTISGNWAYNLVSQEGGVYADFAAYLRPATILGKFGVGGVPSLRNVPFRVPLISQTGGGAGYWVGQGKGKPLTALDFARTTMEPLKVANIAVLTEESIRDSSPSSEMIVRDSLRDALVARLDTDFIDPSKSASAGVSPASITFGAATVASTGTSADAVRLDVRALFAKFIAANNPPSTGVWLMSTTNALALALMVNALGQPEFPGITMMGGSFFGLPVIVSDYIGSVVVLANASDIYEADEGGVAVDMSRETSLEMSDGPAQSALTGGGASMVSMFQTNSVALRAERTINWKLRRSSAVAYLTGVVWGGAVPAS
ncbi:phage major capsid protein [Mesorhizobium sp. ESP-6-4]|uniref:phage major capsid protein n=1 Tax=Mesorhizobium sp. ESP-6-4 TaxID=2876624 RepID=UPI001CCFFF95|nr:phage major capsid protein [Mesorhizobium sp. ESP-6-4]MBZ9659790.1 phage major capsid protein [Mesorhizobium sp. ESP-6-4]